MNTTTGVVIGVVAGFAAGVVSTELCHKDSRKKFNASLSKLGKRITRKGDVEVAKREVELVDNLITLNTEEAKELATRKEAAAKDLRDAELAATVESKQEEKEEAKK